MVVVRCSPESDNTIKLSTQLLGCRGIGMPVTAGIGPASHPRCVLPFTGASRAWRYAYIDPSHVLVSTNTKWQQGAPLAVQQLAGSKTHAAAYLTRAHCALIEHGMCTPLRGEQEARPLKMRPCPGCSDVKFAGG
jgi:hypothetical protein